jgi:methyl-accepting chemotaxis protein
MLKILMNNKFRTSSNENDCNADFISAIAIFSLTHTELISFNAMLKVKEIAEGAAELTSESQETASIAEEVSASIEQINASMQEINSGAEDVTNQIDELSAFGNRTETVLNSMLENVDELSSQVVNIEDISQNVSDIAEQTNLLSLNAAIEAARAGDAGRGFNVVAEEVRKLAGQTKNAVHNVKKISEQMNAKSETTKLNITNVRSNFTQYLNNSQRVGEFIKQSTKQIEDCSSMVENITSAMLQQTASAEKLSEISEKLTNHSKFISDMLSHEADNLCSIVTPTLKLTDSESLSSMLATRLVEHANFLKKVMSEAGQKLKVASHTECAFGKWYQANRNRYSSVEAFVEIDEPHRRVHEYSQKLSQKLESRNVEDLMQASADILKAFIKLHASIVKVGK